MSEGAVSSKQYLYGAKNEVEEIQRTLEDMRRNGSSGALPQERAFVLLAEIERAQRIMLRAISWLQIKEAASATHKGKAIIEEMQGFVAGVSHETRELRTWVDPDDPDEILTDFLNEYDQGNKHMYEFDKPTALRMLRAALRRVDSKETNPRITLMNDGRAMGGSDVCHTCEAHCTVINDLQTALDFVLRERITLHDGAFFQRAEVNHPNPSCGWYSFPSMPDGVSATLHEARDRLPANGGMKS